MALASVRDKLGNGATYGGEILHADPGRACVTYGLGLISIGVIIGKKIVPFKQRFLALQRAAATMVGAWRACSDRPGQQQQPGHCCISVASLG